MPFGRGRGLLQAARLGLPIAGLALFLLFLPGACAAPPLSGDWVVTGAESYNNTTFVIEGNVFLRAPGSLNLTNVTLEINSSAGTRRGLIVESGAGLVTRDTDGSTATSGDRTVIRPRVPGSNLFFVADPGSTLDLRQTAIWGVGWTQSPINASGVYLKSSGLTLQNLSVYQCFFGVLFVGASGTFPDLSVHNNTYNGIEIDNASNVTLRGVSAADNGLTGIYVNGGRATLAGASLLANQAEGLAVKFGGSADLTLFDASGNGNVSGSGNGFTALNGARLSLESGRITNNTGSGVDARLASTIVLDSVSFSHNTIGVFAGGSSSVGQQRGEYRANTRAVVLRTLASAAFTDVTFRGQGGSTIDFDTGSATFTRCLFDGNAQGGSVASGGFSFLDSTLSNSTGSGFTLTNTTGVYLHNALLRYNKGRALDLVGTSTALFDADIAMEIESSAVDVYQLAATGSVKLANATLHAIAAGTWNASGPFDASNASIVGDVAGASLNLLAGSSARVRGLSLGDFSLRIAGSAGSFDVDGLVHTGLGEIATTGGTYTLHNVTQGPGSGRVRAGTGSLTLLHGSALQLQADGSATVDARDFTANLGAATYGPSAVIRQWWTLGVRALWQSSAAAPAQSFTLTNASGTTVASGTTDAQGNGSVGYALVVVGTNAGTTNSNPFRLSAGSGSWSTDAFYNVTAASTLVITLQDLVRPTLVLTSPADGSRINSSSPTLVTGLASDGESGLASLEWSYDNTSFTPQSATASFAIPVPTPFETSYNVFVRVFDAAGNTAFANVSFRVDRSAPPITVTQPLNNALLRGPTIHLVGRTEAGSTFTVNGQPIATDASGDFDAFITVADGAQDLVLVAVDAAGNTNLLTLPIRVDSLPPAIAIESPANGSSSGNTTITLVGRIEPGASLYVDAVAQLVAANGSFSVLVDLLRDGPNTLRVRAIDPAGNANETTWVIFRDRTPPQILVEGFVGAGPFFVNRTRPVFNITTDEWAQIVATTTAGDGPVQTEGRQLFYSPALAEGNFTLTVVATDLSGNTNATTLRLTVDLTPPNFTLDPRTTGGYTNANPHPFVVTTEPGARVTVLGQWVPPTSPGGSVFQASVTLAVGFNRILITVADAAGNLLSATVNLTLDQDAPILLVISPAQGESIQEAQVEVRGRTEPGATVTVDGTPGVVLSDGTFAGLAQLRPGSNTVEVVATDAAGNQKTALVDVVREAKSGTITGIQALDENLGALLLFLAALVVAGAAWSSMKSRRRVAQERAALIEKDLERSVVGRSDLYALENFQPALVNDPDFVSASEYRRRLETAPPAPPAQAEPAEPLKKRKGKEE